MSSSFPLGGGARGALRDGSSRYNSLAGRSRESFGGTEDGGNSPQKMRRGLLDTTGYRTRRQSLGGDALRSELPIRDRRAMLQAWRQNKASQREEDNDSKKRSRGDPPLPPCSSHTSNSDYSFGNSRKLQKSLTHSQESDDQGSFSQNSAFSVANGYDDESVNHSKGSGSLLAARTPLKRRGKLGSARRQSLMGRSFPKMDGKSFFAMHCRRKVVYCMVHLNASLSPLLLRI